MLKQSFIIKSVNGLSSRASASLVSEANKYNSNLHLLYASEKANLKSIMNVMALVIQCGEKIQISCDGEDEQAALDGIKSIMEEIKLI